MFRIIKRFYIICCLIGLTIGCTANAVTLRDRAQEDIVIVNKENTSSPKETQNPAINRDLNALKKESGINSIKNIDIGSEEEDDVSTLLSPDIYKDFDIPIVFNDAVEYYIQYFTTEKRKVFTNWLKRARHYVPIMKEILKENDLPEDMVYLAMIESGFNTKAYSPKKACGPWQFINATGERYGLKVNFWIDERRDPEKSTLAAAKYLKDLFNQFGCWYLAAAGYNAGEGRIEKAINKHNTNDFWELIKYNTLPKETREYIPKLIAAAIIAKYPEKYGFGNIAYEEPIRFKEVRVPPATPLKHIARAASMDISTLRSYNPEILRGITPPDEHNYRIKLPEDINIHAFKEELELTLKEKRTIKSVAKHTIRKKDTIANIIKRYGISYEDLVLVNGIDGNLKIKRGMVLYIPRYKDTYTPKTMVARSQERALNGSKEKVAKKQKANIPAVHIVKHGETLSLISSKYGIDKKTIMEANNLKSEKIFVDMRLKLVKHGETKKIKKQNSYKIHIVKKGETLVSISNKYGINIDKIKSANKLKTGKLYPNMRLKIITEEG